MVFDSFEGFFQTFNQVGSIRMIRNSKFSTIVLQLSPVRDKPGKYYLCDGYSTEIPFADYQQKADVNGIELKLEDLPRGSM